MDINDLIINISLLDLDNLKRAIFSPELQEILFPIKILALGFSLFLFLAVIIFILRTDWLRYRILEDIVHFITYRPYGMKRLEKPWSKISKKLSTEKESEYKLAVIEADSLLDEMLEKSGYYGKNLEERIKQTSSVVISNRQEVLDANKIRNNILADPDYSLDLDQAKKILEIYRKALTDLGLL